jgi:hypothetical protein
MSKSFFSVDKGLRLRPQSAFPSDPTDGDIVNKSNRFYKWNAVTSAWDLIVTPSSADVLTDKVYSGGTASDTNKTILASDTLANINTNVTKTKGTMVFADDLQKPVICGANGQDFTPIGGGLDPVYLSTTGQTAANGKNYLVKTTSSDITLNVPVGGITMMQFGFKDDGDFTAYKLILAPAAGVSIYVAHLGVTVVGAGDTLNIDVKGASGQLDWDTTNSRWVLSLGGFSGLSTLGGGGGGLVVTPSTITTGAVTTPLALSHHYVIDMFGADADKTTALPSGETAANIKVSVIKASPTYKLTITCYGAETITYGGKTDTTFTIPAGCESWVEFCWNGTGWSAEDATTPISGTLSGSLDITGALSFPITSLSDVQATSMGLKQYFHGTTYNGGNAPTLAGWSGSPSIVQGMFIPYQMNDGAWRIKGNICVLGFTSTDDLSLTVNGILAGVYPTYPAITTMTADIGNATTGLFRHYISGNTNVFRLINTNVFSEATLTFDFPLNAKPNWAY